MEKINKEKFDLRNRQVLPINNIYTTICADENKIISDI